MRLIHLVLLMFHVHVNTFRMRKDLKNEIHEATWNDNTIAIYKPAILLMDVVLVEHLSKIIGRIFSMKKSNKSTKHCFVDILMVGIRFEMDTNNKFLLMLLQQ